MSIYASDTKVPIERSKTEIERTLQRYGAGAFMYGSMASKSIIQFEMNNRRIRFDLPMPDPKEYEFTKNGARKSQGAADASFQQACRQRWRALSLAIRAKLESVDCGITTFEEEFLAHIVLPGGKTAGEWMVPQIEEIYEKKKLPPMLTGTKENS